MEEQENNPVLPEINEESVSLDIPVEEVVAEQEETLQDTLPTDDSAMPDCKDTSEQEEVPQKTSKSTAETCATVVERLTAIEVELKRSNQLFDSKFLYDAAKEEMIVKLHKELQAYKDDMFKKILKPVFIDMIKFADSMKALASRFEEVPEAEMIIEKYQKIRKKFLKVGEHIDDFLYNYGIEPFNANAGEQFDAKTQQASKTTSVENPDEHKRIIASLSAGYMWDDQMLRRESVHVNTYEQIKEIKNQ